MGYLIELQSPRNVSEVINGAREVTCVCLCVDLSVSGHTVVPLATEQVKCYLPCSLLGMCVGDGHLANVWLGVKMANRL